MEVSGISVNIVGIILGRTVGVGTVMMGRLTWEW